MIGGYIVQTPSFEKKKYKRASRRRTRTSNRYRRSSSSSNRRRRSRKRRIKRGLQKGGSDCVSYGFKGLSDGLGSAQYSLN